MIQTKRQSVRFFDWNSLLGTILFTFIFALLIGFAVKSPEAFRQDESALHQVIVILSPFMMIYGWYRLTIYVDFGGTITFRKLWTKRSYEWSEIDSLEFEVETNSHLFGLIKNENLYLTFGMLRDGKVQKFAYLLRKKNQHELVDMVKLIRPDLQIHV